MSYFPKKTLGYWRKYTVSYTDISDPGFNKTISIETLGAKEVVETGYAILTTQFSGGLAGLVNIVVDSTVGLNTFTYIPSYDVISNPPSNTNYKPGNPMTQGGTNKGLNDNVTTPSSIDFTINSDDALNNLTQGQVDIFLKISQLP